MKVKDSWYIRSLEIKMQIPLIASLKILCSPPKIRETLRSAFSISTLWFHSQSLLKNVLSSDFKDIESHIQEDEGNRGIAPLVIQGELLRSTKDIFSSSHVAIMTGFPCNLAYLPPTETDGPPGAVAIARACLSLSKHVTLLTDQVSAADATGILGNTEI
mmetsp:Transcript_26143/g.34348  ORF Transcript_26143/g.34348 Transcript_26143/m.34348 type:complete len:160 (+) Transcript_26143:521-1000(+)